MPILVCVECGYETRDKYRMLKHFKNKLPCPNARIIVDKQMMQDIKGDLSLLKIPDYEFIELGSPEEASNPPNSTPNASSIPKT